MQNGGFGFVVEDIGTRELGELFCLEDNVLDPDQVVIGGDG